MDPMLMMALLMAALIIPMWLMARGQKKRVKAQEALVDSLGVGDEVRTHAGFYGMIVETDGDTVILEAEDGSQLKWHRRAIAEKVESFGQANEATTTR